MNPPAAANNNVTYVLDSNIFIEAKQRYYAFDVCPGFWDALVWQHGQGKIVSVDRVKAELEGFGDDLSMWVTGTMPDGCFFDMDMDVVTQAYADAIAWVMGQTQFTEAAKAEFADAENADAWVIAFAKAMDVTVVTHEKPNPDIRRKVPIPNVCDALGVVYVDSFEMLRKLETLFSWHAP
jgi:hypothetical protein